MDEDAEQAALAQQEQEERRRREEELWRRHETVANELRELIKQWNEEHA